MADAAKAAEATKPVDAKPAGAVTPADAARPVEAAAPAVVKPVDVEKPAEVVKPAVVVQPLDIVKPEEVVKPTDSVNPAEDVKPADVVTAADAVKPAADLEGGIAPRPDQVVKKVDDALRTHLRRIYDNHGGSSGPWTKETITKFINEIQKDSSPTDRGAAVTDLLARETLDFEAFVSYMISDQTNITRPHKPIDLSWPLSSYFISSSHNTYLSGNQLSSDSSTDSYTKVLRRGCRCVEVDVWDGDDSDSDSSEDEAPKESAKSLARHASKRVKGKLGRFNTLRDKLPDSVAARLEKSSIGKKLDELEARNNAAAAAETGTTPRDKAAKSPKLQGDSDSQLTVVAESKPLASPSSTGEKSPQKSPTPPTPEAAIVEPRVLHGYTLTKEISFRDVCVAIEKYAFYDTDLPLIVSLEVHCKPAQQIIMVQIMKEIWGHMLVADPEEEPTALPSPEQLRNKIIVKVKYAAPGSSPPPEEESAEDDGSLQSPPRSPSKKPSPPASTPEDKKKKKKQSKIIQELSKMGVYARGVSFKGFEQPEAKMPTHIFSLSEKKFLDYHEKKGSELWKHNIDYMMRAYPSGLRISSSNLNPAVFWGYGTQVVALNWQQTDEGMMLNEGMFSGTQGYILKPEGYRPQLKSKPDVPNKVVFKTASLCITFYAAKGLPLPPGDTSAKSFEPYVKVELHADAADVQRGGHIVNQGHEREAEYKARTRTLKGCDLDFAREKLEFRGIAGLVEELTFVRFTVRDDEIGRDDLAAFACVRLDRLGDGYRFIHLSDCDGFATKGYILVKVEKTLS